MRKIADLLAILPLAPIAHAQAAAPIAHAGEIVRTATGAKVGQIDRVNDDGSLRIIYEDHFITLPVASISNHDGKVITSLAIKDINKLPD